MARVKLLGLGLCGLVIAMGSAAAAQIPDLMPTVVCAASDRQVSLYCLPNGDGNALTQAREMNSAAPVDATITLTLLDRQSQPVPCYPAEDMWLETSLNGLVHCPGGTIAGANTDAAGVTTFVDPLRAGRQSDRTAGETLIVLVSGAIVDGSQLDILVNSPDLDGNLVVNLSDAVLFTQDAAGTYSYRSDFCYDNVINLSDAVLFARGLGADCP